MLTLGEYTREYGDPKPGCVNFALPMPSVLAQALGARPVLFLGCSLKSDRTTLIVAKIAHRLPGTVHFAVVSESEAAPDRLRQLDAWNIRPLFFPAGHFEKIEQLLACVADASPALPPGGPRPIPKEPPPGFVPRPEEFEQAKRQLLQNHGHGSIALSTALSGAGGYGKTTLAQALCADQEIRNAFADGIFWIDIGQTPNILGGLGSLYKELTGAKLATVDQREASAMVAKELENRWALLVIDDVWQRGHLKAFLDAAPCKRLITTRVVEILDEDVDLVRVDEMGPGQAVELLLKGIPERGNDVRGALQDLAHRLGYWALLLELANAKLRVLKRRRGGALAAALDLSPANISAGG